MRCVDFNSTDIEELKLPVHTQATDIAAPDIYLWLRDTGVISMAKEKRLFLTSCVLYLHYCSPNRMDNKQIAGELDLTTEYVRNLLKAGLKKLQMYPCHQSVLDAQLKTGTQLYADVIGCEEACCTSPEEL